MNLLKITSHHYKTPFINERRPHCLVLGASNSYFSFIHVSERDYMLIVVQNHSTTDRSRGDTWATFLLVECYFTSLVAPMNSNQDGTTIKIQIDLYIDSLVICKARTIIIHIGIGFVFRIIPKTKKQYWYKLRCI